jgi:osmotically-inducible protein OsmY
VRSIILAAAFTTAMLPAQSQSDSSTMNSGQAQPDNTKMNRQNRKSAQPNADQAKNNKSDIQIMRDIRRAIVKDKSLSTYGHNVKVIAKNGQVTLKGPVHSDDEKNAIQKDAESVAGDGKVTNEITVKGDAKK